MVDRIIEAYVRDKNVFGILYRRTTGALRESIFSKFGLLAMLRSSLGSVWRTGPGVWNKQITQNSTSSTGSRSRLSHPSLPSLALGENLRTLSLSSSCRRSATKRVLSRSKVELGKTQPVDRDPSRICQLPGILSFVFEGDTCLKSQIYGFLLGLQVNDRIRK